MGVATFSSRPQHVHPAVRQLIETDSRNVFSSSLATTKMLNAISEIGGRPIEREWIDGEDVGGVGTMLRILESKWGVVDSLELILKLEA